MLTLKKSQAVYLDLGLLQSSTFGIALLRSKVPVANNNYTQR